MLSYSKETLGRPVAGNHSLLDILDRETNSRVGEPVKQRQSYDWMTHQPSDRLFQNQT